MRIKRLGMVLAFVAATAQLSALNHYSMDSLYRCDIDPVIMNLDSMSYSSLTRNKLFLCNDELLSYINMSPEQLPQYTDAEIEKRMKLIPSMVNLQYNRDVRAFIDFFVYKRREMMTRMLANAQIYFPMFEEALDRKKMPIELKYLPIVESAFNPLAQSHAGAVGLWQLMPGTARLLGLDINSYVDERKDPHLSTQAAVEYMRRMYNIYHDWQLVLAAYNSGPGNVNKAIARAGGVKDFWTIKNFLPSETRAYVPIFIAAVYVMHYAKDYHLYPAEPKRELYSVDTVMVSAKVSLQHISNVVGIPQNELQMLNPSLRVGVVPNTANGFALNLPVNYFGIFESRKDIILNDTTQAVKVAEISAVPSFIIHKVRSGESISNVARKYHCTTKEIMKWNRLRSSYLQKGQKLKILTFPAVPAAPKKEEASPAKPASPAQPIADEVVANGDQNTSGEEAEDGSDTVAETSNVHPEENEGAGPTKVQPAPKEAPKAKVMYYVVQRGDTLWNIAQKKGLSVTKLRTDNGLSPKSTLKIGTKLKIVL